MSLSIFRKWLAAYMLIACLFILAACNGSSSNGGPVPPAFPSEALSNIGINITAPDGGTIESVNTESGSIEVVWNSAPDTGINSFFTQIATVLGDGILAQDDAEAKVIKWEHSNNDVDYVCTVTHNKENGKLILAVTPRPEFPKDALSAIGIEVAKPAGLKIEDVQDDEAGTIEVYWIGVAQTSADGFISSMEAALATDAVISQDDTNAKIATWDYAGDEYKVTITFVKENHDLNGSAVKAGEMVFAVEPKTETPDLVLDDSIRRVAAFLAYNPNNSATPNYQFGIIKGNSDINNYSIDVARFAVPELSSCGQKDMKVFAFGNRPKDGSAEAVLERYCYPSVGVEGGSVFTTFDVNGEINESTIATDEKDWGSNSVHPASYAVNARNTVRMGNYLYIISWEVGRISKVHLTTGKLVSSIAIDVEVDDPKFTPKGQDIIVTNGRIFALFMVSDSNNKDYENSVVVEVKHTNNNKAPTFVDSGVKVGKNAQSLVPVDNYIYVPSIGGMQNSNKSNKGESRIDRITLSENGMIVNPAYYVDDDCDFNGLAIGKEKTLILRVMQGGDYSTSEIYLTQINTTDLHEASNLAVSTLPSENHIIEPSDAQNGFIHSIFYDGVLEHFWYTTTGKLTVYNKDITDQHDFDMRNDIHGTRAGAIASISLFATELGKR